MSRISFSLLLAFVSCSAIAQQDLPGFVVTTQNDTIKGSLSARKLSSYECLFTAANQTSETIYLSSNLIGFGLDNGRYFGSYKIKVGDSFVVTFVEVLASGKMNLLKYDEKYFLAEAAETIQLEQTRSITNQDGRPVEQINNKYWQTLAWKFADCPSVVDKLKIVTLDDRSLTRIFDDYNSCVGKKTTTKKSSSKRSGMFAGVEVGFMSSHVSKIREDYDEILDSKFKTSTTIFPGVFFHLQTAGRVITSMSIGIQTVHYLFESRKDYHQGVDIHDHVKVSYNDLKIPFSVGREFGHGNIKPFVRLGTVLNIYTNKQSTREKEVTIDTPVTVTNPAFNIVNRPLTGMLDAGVQFQRGKFVGMLRGRFEYGAAPFRETAFKQGQNNITQKSYSAMLSFGYKISK